MSVTELLRDVKSWASSEDAIQAVLLVGSHARDEAGPNSDVDLVILAQNPSVYTEDTDYLSVFGKCLLAVREDYGRLISIRAFYEDGLEVEFGFTSLDWVALPLDSGTQRVLADGYRVLLDKSQAMAPFGSLSST